MRYLRKFNESEDFTDKIFSLIDSEDESNRELGFELIKSQPVKSKVIEELVGKVFSSVNADKENLYFISDNDKSYIFYHEQDCCEYVTIEDIDGDLNDLVGTPILKAEEVTKEDINASEYGYWTFYKFSTIKGYVTVRWYVESYGYYSVPIRMCEYNPQTKQILNDW
jgi:hypothetical protein